MATGDERAVWVDKSTGEITGVTRDWLDETYAEPVTEALADKADLTDGRVPEAQLPANLSAGSLNSTFGMHLTAPESGSATAMIQAAVDASGGLPVTLRAGDYTLDGSITGDTCNVVLESGARLLITTNDPAFEISGGGSGTSRAIQEDVSPGDTIVEANTVGMNVGDYVFLRATATWPGPKATKMGEIHRVIQIDGTTQFRTEALIDFTYSGAGLDSVVVFSLATGVKITGEGEIVNTIGATLTEPAVRLTACLAPVLNVRISEAGGPGVTISACIDPDVTAYVRGSHDDEAEGNFGYGVEAFGPTRGGRVYVEQSEGRHAFTTNGGTSGTGIPAHITVSGIATGLTDTAWDTHAEGYDITFAGVAAFGCRNGGVKHRAPGSRVVNPVIQNTRGIGVRFTDTATGGLLIGGDIRALHYLSDGSPGVGVQIEGDDVVVSGAPLIECDDQGVLVIDGANNASIVDGTYRAGLRENAGTDIGIEFEGTSIGQAIGAAVRLDAATAIVIASTVTLADERPARRRMDLEALASSVSHVNFNTIQNSSTAWANTRRLSSGVQNDEVVFVEHFAAGTWSIDLFHDTSNQRGIYTVAMAPVAPDGTIGTYSDIGTVDGYAVTGARERSTISGVAVARSSLWAVRVRMATKNASSGSYFGSLSKLTAVKTA